MLNMAILPSGAVFEGRGGVYLVREGQGGNRWHRQQYDYHIHTAASAGNIYYIYTSKQGGVCIDNYLHFENSDYGVMSYGMAKYNIVWYDLT